MRALLLAVLLLISLSANADMLDMRLQSFAKITYRKANFTETFNASYLNKPIVSHGILEYKSPDYLIKKINGPDAASYMIVKNIMTVKRDGETRQIDLSKQPDLGIGIDALRDLLRGNRSDLNKRFWISYQMNEQDPQIWQLLLIPRSKSLLQKVIDVEMRGDKDQLQVLSIKYANDSSLVTRITENE